MSAEQSPMVVVPVDLVVRARVAALDAACRLVADGHTKWTVRAPLELAEQFEAWILRPDPDSVDTTRGER